MSIQTLAWPLPVVRAGVIVSGARFVFESDTERDDGQDAYVVPVTAAGRIIDLCAFSTDAPGVATWAGTAKALGEDEAAEKGGFLRSDARPVCRPPRRDQQLSLIA